MTKTAFYAFILVDRCYGFVVQIEVLPVGDIWNGCTAEILQRGVAFFIHPVAKAIDEVIDDAETVAHDRCTYLYATATQ